MRHGSMQLAGQEIPNMKLTSEIVVIVSKIKKI
jgi:hypothetical protein